MNCENCVAKLFFVFERYLWPALSEGLLLKVPAFFSMTIRFLLSFAHNGNGQRAATMLIFGIALFVIHYVLGSP